MSEELSAEVVDVRKGLPSASMLYRLQLCPGSYLACQVIGEDEESDDAMRGTRLHKHMEDSTLPEDPEEAEVIDWIENTESAILDKLKFCEPQEIREGRLWLKDDKGMDILSGVPDYLAIDDKRALIVDYKFGFLAVDPAESNLQLAALAVLAAEKYGLTEVYACILAPYVSRGEPGLVRFDAGNLAKARDYLVRLVSESIEPNSELKPSEKACRYCKARLTCPAVGCSLSRISDLDCSVVWANYTPEQKRSAYDLARMAKKWAEAVERRIKSDLIGGEVVPGLSIGKGRSMFSVTDPSSVYGALSAHLGITAVEFTKCCNVGITELDKLVHTKRKDAEIKTTVKESKEWLRNTIAKFAETKVSEGSIKEG